MADSCRRLTFTANVLPSSRHFTEEVPSIWSMWLKQDFCVEFFVVANTSSWNLRHNWLLLPMTASASSGFPPLTSRDTISDIFRGTRRQKTQYGCHQTVVVRTMRPLGCDNGKWYRGRGNSKLIKQRTSTKKSIKNSQLFHIYNPLYMRSCFLVGLLLHLLWWAGLVKFGQCFVISSCESKVY